MNIEKKDKILVIDDEKGVRDATSFVIGSAGYKVATASNGNEALEMLKNEKFSVLVSDLKMPNMDGIQLLKEVKKTNPDIEVIMYTAYPTIEIAVDAMRKGAYSFIKKPYNINELLMLIERALEKVTMKVKIDELNYNEEHLRILFEYAPDAYFINEIDGTFIDGNKKTEDMTGFKKEELIGKKFFNLNLLSMDQLPKAAALLVKNSLDVQTGPDEFILNRKDGTAVTVDISTYPAKIRGKSIVLNIARDVTERKKTENDLRKLHAELKESTAQLIQTEKISALGELTAGVAHELNQPLNGIKIICQSILRDVKRGESMTPEGLSSELGEIVCEVNRMASIIDHMRIFTRRTEGSTNDMVDIRTVIDGAFKFTVQQLMDYSIEIEKTIEPGLPEILGDAIRLEQVMLNFITNARDALIKSKKEHKKLRIKAYRDKGSLIIEIKDNGTGIPKEIQEKVFEPFFTTKEVGKGTGLGLSVAKKIVEEHKGKIELESPPAGEAGKAGEGTVFKIILPAGS
ncbi:MAG: response regulator [Elusimicrobia bacterium]|nr:response regulator [Candidatus Liberimonas magnetica]